VSFPKKLHEKKFITTYIRKSIVTELKMFINAIHYLQSEWLLV